VVTKSLWYPGMMLCAPRVSLMGCRAAKNPPRVHVNCAEDSDRDTNGCLATVAVRLTGLGRSTRPWFTNFTWLSVFAQNFTSTRFGGGGRVGGSGRSGATHRAHEHEREQPNYQEEGSWSGTRAPHSTAQHSTAQHSTAQHSTARCLGFVRRCHVVLCHARKQKETWNAPHFRNCVLDSVSATSLCGFGFQSCCFFLGLV